MQEGVLAGTTSFSSAPQARPAQSDDHDEDLRSTDATAQGSLMQGTSGSRRRQASQRHTLAFDDDRRHVSSRSVSPYDTDQDTSSGERSPVRTKTRTIRKPQHRS